MKFDFMLKDKNMINTDKPAIIAVTHCGVFHSDEVLACALLKIAAGNAEVTIIRSRLPEDWERADYVIDVGGKHDGIKWFDHHQPAGGGSRSNGLNFSAFGLLWEQLGITAVRTLMSSQALVQLTDQAILGVHDELQPFVMGIDAHDQARMTVTAKYAYDHSVYLEAVTIQNIISSMNIIPLMEPCSVAQNDAQFEKALNFAHEFLCRHILRKASKTLAYAYTMSCDRAKPVLVLEQYCGWYQAVSRMPHVEYVVSPSIDGKSYSIQAVRNTDGANGANGVANLRRPFPAEWAGADSSTLPKLSGEPQAIFCHRDRFIAGCSTLESAINLANISITYGKTNPTE